MQNILYHNFVFPPIFRNGVHMTNVPTPESIHIQAPEGQGCPSCGGYVYHADQVQFRTLRVQDGTKSKRYSLINVTRICAYLYHLYPVGLV